MGTEAPEVHVLLQDLDGDSAQWWREPTGAGVARVVMELRLPAHRGAVWVARHWVTDRAGECGVADGVLPDLALLTSELVGNAVVHGPGGEVEVRFSVDAGHVVVEVSDGSTAVPRVRDTPPDVPGGHGLRLVEIIATRWGHRLHPDGLGKTVWFHLDA